MQVKLNSEGWHRKLQEWIFGQDVVRFGSLCPYFWFTIFCMIASPFACMFFVGVKLFKALDSFLEKAVWQPLELKSAEALTPEEMLKMFTEAEDSTSWSKGSKILKKLRKLFLLKKGLDEDSGAADTAWWEQKRKLFELYELNKKKKVPENKPAKVSTKSQELEKLILKLIKITQVVVPVVSVIAVGLILYYGANYLMSLDAIVWEKIIEVTILVCCILVGLATVLFFSILFARSPLSGRVGESFSKFFTALGEKASSIFGIFFDYAAAFKQNYCPLISWEEKEEK